MADTPLHNLMGRSVKNRALLANALCAIAEEEAHDAHISRACETVRALRGVLGEISLLLQSDLPPASLEDTADLLHGLGPRIDGIENLLARHQEQPRR
jgi:hypothetical protein